MDFIYIENGWMIIIIKIIFIIKGTIAREYGVLKAISTKKNDFASVETFNI
jgi:hypothetical protein